MPPDTDSPRILCGCTNLKIAARATGRLYDRALAPFDLNTMQYAILANVARAGRIPTMALSDRLSIERTALYRALAVLERRRLIRTEAGRGREQILSLTEAGEALRIRAKAAWAVTQDAFVGAFGEDWPTFLRLLDRARAISDGMSDTGEAMP
ncbi:MarR family winged helix-turn-helix transcriptional regulator [Prosthecomicrobium hirschii]|uniref:MarR family winged helix-turn-helix transcriptional regulator n=1 Tax=Prosthecodimorpha hirschii TaxID=665126 RepID=UPI00221E6948|nr:MarR family winged helix-turn-helix transcriptional regulator [Prosthecomicrobium hirschii]MCW1840481.1 MarR family winged helix-turn-helix transcriptional regulator [Prosthecomicrobium hirschii]